MMYDDEPHEPTGLVTDDRLRLIFTCCHPALAPEARVALTLRLLGGLTVAEIAEAFFVPETTMAQRITRAKKKIKEAQHPLPRARAGRPHRAARGRARGGLPGLQRGLPLHLRRGADPRRAHRRGDPAGAGPPRAAARRARGRRAARPDAAHRGAAPSPGRRRRAGAAPRAGPGRLGPRADRRGPRAGARVPRRNRPGQYQLLAAINAVHTDAPTAADTDWAQIADALHPAVRRRADARSSRSTARSPSPSSTARGRPGRGRPARPHVATTRGTPPAPTCSAGSAAAPRPGRRTTRPSPPPPTRPSGPTSPGGVARWRHVSEAMGLRVIARLPLASWRLFVATCALARGRLRRRRAGPVVGGARRAGVRCAHGSSTSALAVGRPRPPGDVVAVAARGAGDVLSWSAAPTSPLFEGGLDRGAGRCSSTSWSRCWWSPTTCSSGRTSGRWWWPLTWALLPLTYLVYYAGAALAGLRLPRPLRRLLPARRAGLPRRPRWRSVSSLFGLAGARQSTYDRDISLTGR